MFYYDVLRWLASIMTILDGHLRYVVQAELVDLLKIWAPRNTSVPLNPKY